MSSPALHFVTFSPGFFVYFVGGKRWILPTRTAGSILGLRRGAATLMGIATDNGPSQCWFLSKSMSITQGRNHLQDKQATN